MVKYLTENLSMSDEMQIEEGWRLKALKLKNILSLGKFLDTASMKSSFSFLKYFYLFYFS